METRDRGSGIKVLDLGKRIDTQTAAQVEQALQAACDSGAKKVVCNLADTEYISSAGLRSIVVVAKQMTRLGGELSLAGASPYVKQILEISGFATMLKLYDSEEAAIRGY